LPRLVKTYLYYCNLFQDVQHRTQEPEIAVAAQLSTKELELNPLITKLRDDNDVSKAKGGSLGSSSESSGGSSQKSGSGSPKTVGERLQTPGDGKSVVNELRDTDTNFRLKLGGFSGRNSR
jgi:hypothetical protein